MPETVPLFHATQQQIDKIKDIISRAQNFDTDDENQKRIPRQSKRTIFFTMNNGNEYFDSKDASGKCKIFFTSVSIMKSRGEHGGVKIKQGIRVFSINHNGDVKSEDGYNKFNINKYLNEKAESEARTNIRLRDFGSVLDERIAFIEQLSDKICQRKINANVLQTLLADLKIDIQEQAHSTLKNPTLKQANNALIYQMQQKIFLAQIKQALGKFMPMNRSEYRCREKHLALTEQKTMTIAGAHDPHPILSLHRMMLINLLRMQLSKINEVYLELMLDDIILLKQKLEAKDKAIAFFKENVLHSFNMIDSDSKLDQKYTYTRQTDDDLQEITNKIREVLNLSDSETELLQEYLMRYICDQSDKTRCQQRLETLFNHCYKKLLAQKDSLVFSLNNLTLMYRGFHSLVQKNRQVKASNHELMYLTSDKFRDDLIILSIKAEFELLYKTFKYEYKRMPDTDRCSERTQWFSRVIVKAVVCCEYIATHDLNKSLSDEKVDDVIKQFISDAEYLSYQFPTETVSDSTVQANEKLNRFLNAQSKVKETLTSVANKHSPGHSMTIRR